MGALRACLVCAMIAAVGCDGGGLLTVVSTVDAGVAPNPVGPSVTEMVGAGTVASNSKYKVVYTLGQASPNQGPQTNANYQLNGGLVGAMNGVSGASGDAGH
jgi:hypothetical protein